MNSSTPPAWHQGIVFALTGGRFPELGRQARPDLVELTAFLQARLGVEVDPADLLRPHRLPDDLTPGLGAAQLSAAVAELRRRLEAAAPQVTVATPRPLTTDERRLLAEVPPHHGG